VRKEEGFVVVMSDLSKGSGSSGVHALASSTIRRRWDVIAAIEAVAAAVTVVLDLLVPTLILLAMTAGSLLARRQRSRRPVKHHLASRHRVPGLRGPDAAGRGTRRRPRPSATVALLATIALAPSEGQLGSSVLAVDGAALGASWINRSRGRQKV
jgi:hypothetical protein